MAWRDVKTKSGSDRERRESLNRVMRSAELQNTGGTEEGGVVLGFLFNGHGVGS